MVPPLRSIAANQLNDTRGSFSLPRTSSGFNTRSKLFAHRKDQRVAQARERTDYHLWGSDYAFPADPVEGRNVKKALQNAGRGDRGWSDVHAPENHPRFQATW